MMLLSRHLHMKVRWLVTRASLMFDSSPVSVAQIRRWTSVDPALSRVYRYVRDSWPSGDESLGLEFQPYKSRIGELSIEDGCVLWGARVVVPPKVGRAC